MPLVRQMSGAGWCIRNLRRKTLCSRRCRASSWLHGILPNNWKLLKSHQKEIGQQKKDGANRQIDNGAKKDFYRNAHRDAHIIPPSKKTEFIQKGRGVSQEIIPRPQGPV